MATAEGGFSAEWGQDAKLDEQPGGGRDLLEAEAVAHAREPSRGSSEQRVSAAEPRGAW